MTTNQLRNILGTKHRNHLAVEELTSEVPSTEDTTVVMKGPLADVYSDALLKTHDKSAPIDTGADAKDGQSNDGQGAPADPTAAAVDTTGLVPNTPAEQGTVETAIASEVATIVLESQAIDAAVSQALADSLADEPPANGGTFETLYAIDETQVKPEDVKDVTAILAEAEKPESVTVLIDNVVPEGVIEEAQQAEVAAAKELSVSLESIVVAMGGKVVHNFKDYLASRRK